MDKYGRFRLQLIARMMSQELKNSHPSPASRCFFFTFGGQTGAYNLTPGPQDIPFGFELFPLNVFLGKRRGIQQAIFSAYRSFRRLCVWQQRRNSKFPDCPMAGFSAQERIDFINFHTAFYASLRIQLRRRVRKVGRTVNLLLKRSLLCVSF